MRRSIFAICAAVLVSGCYSLQGSERILDRDGMVTREVPQTAVFRADFKRAYSQRVASTAVLQSDVDAMLESGFQHVYSYCDSYFDSMGLQQRKSRIARDSIAPISALITGVLALQNFDKHPGQKEDLVAALGIATAGAAAALNIYDQNMLFGAENIGSVETLTKAALVTHSATVLTLKNISYSAAIRHLLDNQAICSPQHILLLTREAIKEGKVTARTIEASTAVGVVGTSAVKEGDQRIEVSVDNDQ